MACRAVLNCHQTGLFSSCSSNPILDGFGGGGFRHAEKRPNKKQRQSRLRPQNLWKGCGKTFIDDVQNGTGYKLPTKTDKRAEQHQSASVFVLNNFLLAISGLYHIFFGVAKTRYHLSARQGPSVAAYVAVFCFFAKRSTSFKNAINKKT